MDIRQAVFFALTYSDLFDYPLTQTELFEYAISDRPLAEKDIAYSLDQLVGRGIVEKDGYYCLVGREIIIETRKSRQKISEKKFRLAKNIAYWLHFIPTIRLIALSGSLARCNADENDDIDFFVISANNTLWITRLLILLVLQVLGRRRQFNQTHAKDAVCVNMMLDESQLAFATIRHDIYTAHEICQLSVLYDVNATYASFVAANNWLYDYLSNKARPSFLKKKKVSLYQHIGTFFCRWLDSLSQKLQWMIMRRHTTSEQIEQRMVAFHPRDYRLEVLAKMEKKKKFIASQLWDIDKEKRINYTRNDHKISPLSVEGFSLISL